VSASTLQRPETRRPADGGVPALRVVIRWAIRLLRREWRQQLLILALITAAVAATFIASAVAAATPASPTGTLGTAQYADSFSGTSAQVSSDIAVIQDHFAGNDVIENQQVSVPGTVATFDLRSQDPRGRFGQPLLSLVSGRYPTTASQVAVTSGVATDFSLRVGSSWTVNGISRTVTGIVVNPQSLLDEFALVIGGQVTSPDNASVLFNAPGKTVDQVAAAMPRAGTLYDAQSLANNNVVNPESISIAAAILGMLLIALVGVGGFTVLAQRRLRWLGMLAAQGATQRHLRLVIRANGVATGVAGAVAGVVIGFLGWLAYRPTAQASAHHVIGLFQLPWTVIIVSMVLAVLASYLSAGRPAKVMSRVPVVTALSGRPPEPKKAGRLALPAGIVLLVIAFLLLGVAGAAPGGGNGQGTQMLALALGLLVLCAAMVLLAPTCLGVVAWLGRRAPISVRLALRDLSRYRSRSAPALAAIALATLIAVIVCVETAGRYANVLDYAGPNLTSAQIVIYDSGQGGPAAGSVAIIQNGPGPSGPSPSAGSSGAGQGSGGSGSGKHHGQPAGSTAASQAALAAQQLAAQQKAADKIASSLGHATVVTLYSTSVSLTHAANGRNFTGQIYLATPQLLSAFGISASQVNPDADILTMRPGLSTMSLMQLNYGGGQAFGPGSSFPCPAGSCLASPPIQEFSQLPSGTSAPNTVVTEHAIDSLHLQSSVGTSGWFIQAPHGLTAAQIRSAQMEAAAAGLSIETRNSIPSLETVVNDATVFGIVLALAILGMSVGLVRSEAGRDLRTLSATGANGTTRCVLVATTAGALGFTGALIGIAGGYLAAIGFARSNQLDGLSSLDSIPLGNLLLILIGMPLIAAAISWLLTLREPASIARQPLD
jgi:putative ABC transport system permease protein